MVPFNRLISMTLHEELKDYFYYAMLKTQGMDILNKRITCRTIPIKEVPCIFRAIGIYPSEQEVSYQSITLTVLLKITRLLDELRYDDYYETQKEKDTVEFDRFVRLLINHKYSQEDELQNKLEMSFSKISELLKDENDSNPETGVDTAKLIHLLLTKGEAMTETELADDLTTLIEGKQSKNLEDLDIPDKLTLEDLYSKILQIVIKPEDERPDKITRADTSTSTIDS